MLTFLSVYQLPPRSNRGKPPDRYSPKPSTKVKYHIAHYMSTQRLAEAYQAFVNQMSTVATPSKVQDTLSDSKWVSAKTEEMQALEKNQTWELVQLPEGNKPVGCIKHKPNGFIDSSLRELGLGDSFLPLKNTVMSRAMMFILYFLKGRMLSLTALIIYVDDMIVTGDDLNEIGKLKGYLASKFNMKDLGGLKYFLGIENKIMVWKNVHIKFQLIRNDIKEAEYRTMVKGVCELLWLKRLMGELGFPIEDTMKLYCDNQSIIKIAENLIQHDRTKCVEIHRNFIYEKLEEKIIEVPYVKTTEQLVNMLTKAVSNQAFTDSLVKLSIFDIYAPS
ncbi:unnamed protein product [Prunus armeniaca]